MHEIARLTIKTNTGTSKLQEMLRLVASTSLISECKMTTTCGMKICRSFRAKPALQATMLFEAAGTLYLSTADSHFLESHDNEGTGLRFGLDLILTALLAARTLASYHICWVLDLLHRVDVDAACDVRYWRCDEQLGQELATTFSLSEVVRVGVARTHGRVWRGIMSVTNVDLNNRIFLAVQFVRDLDAVVGEQTHGGSHALRVNVKGVIRRSAFRLDELKALGQGESLSSDFGQSK